MDTCEIAHEEEGQMDQINPLKSSEGAIQMLVWAIEEIAKTGNTKAEHHARLALKYLQTPDQPTNF
jgi:hypothetical protein